MHVDQPEMVPCRDTKAMVSAAGEAVAAGAASEEGAALGGEAELEAGEGAVDNQEHQNLQGSDLCC